MNITEIEGLSHSELRERHDELVLACKDMESAVLAPRYVQARTDAVMRDATLEKQGETILALQTGLKAAEERVAAINATAKDRIKASDKAIAEQTVLVQQIQDALDATSKEFAQLRAEATQVQLDCKAAEDMAKARRTALADVMKHANTLSALVAPLLANEG